MTDNTQSEALDLADGLDGCGGLTSKSAAAELRRPHAELETLPVGYINRGIAPHTKGKTVFHEKPTINLEARWWSRDEPVFLASHGQAPAHVLHLVQDAFAEVAMAYPKAFALHKVGLADTAVRKALATPTPQAAQQAPAGAWMECWYGSGGKEGYEGWSIVSKEGRALVAYLGRGVEPDAVTEIVMAHNATRAATHGQAPAKLVEAATGAPLAAPPAMDGGEDAEQERPVQRMEGWTDTRYIAELENMARLLRRDREKLHRVRDALSEKGGR